MAVEVGGGWADGGDRMVGLCTAVGNLGCTEHCTESRIVTLLIPSDCLDQGQCYTGFGLDGLDVRPLHRVRETGNGSPLSLVALYL